MLQWFEERKVCVLTSVGAISEPTSSAVSHGRHLRLSCPGRCLTWLIHGRWLTQLRSSDRHVAGDCDGHTAGSTNFKGSEETDFKGMMDGL